MDVPGRSGNTLKVPGTRPGRPTSRPTSRPTVRLDNFPLVEPDGRKVCHAERGSFANFTFD